MATAGTIRISRSTVLTMLAIAMSSATRAVTARGLVATGMKIDMTTAGTMAGARTMAVRVDTPNYGNGRYYGNRGYYNRPAYVAPYYGRSGYASGGGACGWAQHVRNVYNRD